MSAKDAHLYGLPRPKPPPSKSKPISSANTLAFSTALSSLISSSKPSLSNTASKATTARLTTTPSLTTTNPRRPKPTSKLDIFATHNRNTASRAAKDQLAYETDRKHALARVDDDSWRRVKRRMEDKARLYAAMKRGDVEDEGERYAVDFDRMWAEREKEGAGKDEAEDEEDESGSDDEQDKVEFMDEFGRTRIGSRAEAAREDRRRRTAVREADEPDRFSARPAVPKTGVIYGDTIQAAAFNPDELAAAQMADLAGKRDRELTPPPEVHYDADWEVRTKGTGFFKFSQGGEERRREMEALERERRETEKVRGEGATIGEVGDKEKRRREVEERRKMLRERRGKMKADRFLQELGGEMIENGLEASGSGADGGNDDDAGQ